MIAPNVETSSICCPGFLFSSSAVAGNNYCLRMKPKQKLRPSVGFTSVTGDIAPLLIKHLGGGHIMHSTSFMLAYTFLSDVEETNVYCITKPFTVPLSSYLPLHLCCFLVFSEPKWPHEQRNHGRSWWMPPTPHCLPPFPQVNNL